MERSQAGCDARWASLAHGRHAAGVLCRGWNGERERARRGAEAGQTRAGLGWAEAKWAGVGAGVRWAGFGRGPRNEAAAREKRKTFFKLCFQEIFKYQFFQISF